MGVSALTIVNANQTFAIVQIFVLLLVQPLIISDSMKQAVIVKLLLIATLVYAK